MIVVDAGSSDGTTELAEAFPFVTVLVTGPGLTGQLNEGAKTATGDTLWFLHADTTLPDPHTIDAIVNVMESPQVVGGACRFNLRGDDLYFRVIGAMVNLRARLLRRPYGDQGIFVRRSVFHDLGGFPDIPRCVDLDFVLRLRREGEFVILRPRVDTSARTWRRYGKLRTTAWHLREWLTYEWERVRG